MRVTAGCGRGALTDAFGLSLQALLALLAFASLLIKRALQPPLLRRPWPVWGLDASKQAIGASLIHLLNVGLAVFGRGDPCTWYVVSFVLDSTLGIAFIYACVRLVSVAAARQHWHNLRFGDYGNPIRLVAWVKQSGVFAAIVLLEKLLVTFLLQWDVWTAVRRVILWPVPPGRAEVTVTMFLIPLLLNTLQFWLIDGFTRRPSPASSADPPPKRSAQTFGAEVGSLERLLEEDEESGENLVQRHSSLS